jgi:hypothetical protein
MRDKPVAWIRSGDDQLSLVKGPDDGYMVWKPLYAKPQVKKLTEDEIKECADSVCHSWKKNGVGELYMGDFARAIIKKAIK